MKTIKAYKGGRSDQLHVRITPASKLVLEREAERLGVSVADLIEELARKIQEGNVK